MTCTSQEYASLAEAIKADGPWWHYLESTWLVATTLTPNAVRDAIKGPLDTSDRVIILNITGDSYQGMLAEQAWEWIRKYV